MRWLGVFLILCLAGCAGPAALLFQELPNGDIRVATEDGKPLPKAKYEVDFEARKAAFDSKGEPLIKMPPIKIGNLK